MAEDNLKDFTINWMIAGLLFFCLLAFAITFMYNNNPTGLSDGTDNMFNESYNGFSNRLLQSSEDSNTLLNVTSNTNPEISQLGSRDSVAVSYSAKGSATSYWDSSKKMISWVFAGTTGKILLGTIGGMIGFLSLFYIWRFIRNGS